MKSFIDQLLSADPFAIAMLIWVCVRLILGVFELIATRNTSAMKKTLLEVQNFMGKFRLPDYQETDPEAKKANTQSFTRFTDKYVYDEDTGTLELAVNPETGEVLQKDDQEYIDSFASTALDKVLERFLPSDYAKTVAPLTDDQFNDKGSESISDLKDYASILEHAEELRDKYGLDPDMSCIDVFNFVDDLNNRYKAKIDGYNQAKQEVVQQPKEAVQQPKEAVQQPTGFIDYDQLAQAILKNQSKEVK